MTSFLRRKRADDLMAEAEEPGRQLKRTLTAFDLTMLGVGAIIGAGIFSSLGDVIGGGASHVGAGPGAIVSFLLTATVCGFAAMCYAEIAAMVPIAGSAYTYSYVAFGEVVAWIIGWDLIIEYAIGNIYVAQSWADNLGAFLRDAFGVQFPGWLSTNIQTVNNTPELAAGAPHIGGFAIAFNLPATLIVTALTILLVRGIRESARFNGIMVVVKVAILLAFIGIGAFFVEPANWTPFAPHGFQGIWTGASIAFFSYIGFDAVSTAAEETADPQRNLPRGMIYSLVICTVLYIAVAAVITGLVPWQALTGVSDPLPHTLEAAGLRWFAVIISVGAVIATTAVLLVFQMGQPRIFMAMSRDGLLPPAFGRVHPRFRTPHVGTILTGVIVAVSASILTPSQAIELTNIGTLFAFFLVSGGVIALRIIEPDRHRPFRVPGYPVVPILSMGACTWLMFGLPLITWPRFGIWLAIGLVIYFLYGRKHSRMAAKAA
jgi:basic amino acid/polyamine antiporter, APA family